ncbi:hypothetical protein [Sphingobacterium cavernae]|uniref:hypothetical protein n=1 Tax=Sphingobacterium cavernae TaxID=2592657 RepID=UPI00122FBFE2|nr:hypothetical protein [Sphingobacterium cavernae]
MNIDLLNQLKQDGFRYLFRKHDKAAFSPIKQLPEKISDTPLMEDELISIEDAIEFANSLALKNSIIILK